MSACGYKFYLLVLSTLEDKIRIHAWACTDPLFLV